MKEILLTQGKSALVSDWAFEEQGYFKWQARLTRGKWYAVRNVGTWPFQKTLYLHREIMRAPKGVEVDHVDGDGLNCQDDNMRLATQTQNSANRGKQNNNTSGFKGVTWDARRGKWYAYIRVNRKRIFLGYYGNIIDAALAYNRAAIKYFGEFAVLNFPKEQQ